REDVTDESAPNGLLIGDGFGIEVDPEPIETPNDRVEVCAETSQVCFGHGHLWGDIPDEMDSLDSLPCHERVGDAGADVVEGRGTVDVDIEIVDDGLRDPVSMPLDRLTVLELEQNRTPFTVFTEHEGFRIARIGQQRRVPGSVIVAEEPMIEAGSRDVGFVEGCMGLLVLTLQRQPRP